MLDDKMDFLDKDIQRIRQQANHMPPEQFNPMLVSESKAKPIEGLYLIPLDDNIIPFQQKGTGDFTPYTDDEIQDMADKMDEKGSYEPVIFRQTDTGKFEILAGEQRVKASRVKGLKNIRAIVYRNCSDQEAMDIFLLTNLQRRPDRISDLIYGWKTFHDNHPSIKNAKEMDDAINIPELAKSGKIKISITQYYRYVSMANLIPQIISALDKKQLSVRAGYNLSFLSHKDQENVFPYLSFVTEEKAKALKDAAAEGSLTKDQITDILSPKKENQHQHYDSSLRRDMTHIKKTVIQNIKPTYYGRVYQIVEDALREYLEKNPQYAIEDSTEESAQ